MTRKDFLTFISSFDLTCKKLHKLFSTFQDEEFSFDCIYEKEFLKIVGEEALEKIKQKLKNMKEIEKQIKSLIIYLIKL